MSVHDIWLFARANVFGALRPTLLGTITQNCSAILQIPFAEALKCIFESRNCNTPVPERVDRIYELVS